VLNTELLNPASTAQLERAGELLQQGKLVAVPTETVYGLAADATNPDAVSAIFTAKGRPADHPLIVHLHDVSALTHWAQQIPPSAYVLAEAFWPGPLTLLLQKADHVSSVVTGGLDSIGLRVPAHPVLLELLTRFKLAVAAPSANPYKKLSPTSAQQVMATMAGKVDAVLDGGDCEFGLESTIVSLLGERVEVLRAGPIGVAALEKVLGFAVHQPKQHQVKVSGNVLAHYQPNTPLYCLTFSALSQYVAATKQKVAVLHITPLATPLDNTRPASRPQHAYVQMPSDPLAYGRALYRVMYEADALGVDTILVELPGSDPQWTAVHDRLARASSDPKNIVGMLSSST
jgi:L-threonylcarbamoyladenylate synthase